MNRTGTVSMCIAGKLPDIYEEEFNRLLSKASGTPCRWQDQLNSEGAVAFVSYAPDIQAFTELSNACAAYRLPFVGSLYDPGTLRILNRWWEPRLTATGCQDISLADGLGTASEAIASVALFMTPFEVVPAQAFRQHAGILKKLRQSWPVFMEQYRQRKSKPGADLLSSLNRLDEWSETLDELGRTYLRKLSRGRPVDQQTLAQALAAPVSAVFLDLLLLTESLGIDLDEALPATFNELASDEDLAVRM